jgi:hypothetical protein
MELRRNPTKDILGAKVEIRSYLSVVWYGKFQSLTYCGIPWKPPPLSSHSTSRVAEKQPQRNVERQSTTKIKFVSILSTLEKTSLTIFYQHPSSLFLCSQAYATGTCWQLAIFLQETPPANYFILKVNLCACFCALGLSGIWLYVPLHSFQVLQSCAAFCPPCLQIPWGFKTPP